MWINEELIEIRDRAELESESPSQNLIWRQACVNLAAAADHLLSLHKRISDGELTALLNKDGTIKRIKPQHPIEK